MDTPSTIDLNRIPAITLSPDELSEMAARIEAGELPPDYMDRYHAAVEANVFGHDHKKDRHGNPIEQGLGSEGNMTRNSVEAYRRWGKDDVNYAENLARMETQLAACEERRKQERETARRKVR
jgi:hypothetical protein